MPLLTPPVTSVHSAVTSVDSACDLCCVQFVTYGHASPSAYRRHIAGRSIRLQLSVAIFCVTRPVQDRPPDPGTPNLATCGPRSQALMHSRRPSEAAVISGTSRRRRRRRSFDRIGTRAPPIWLRSIGADCGPPNRADQRSGPNAARTPPETNERANGHFGKSEPERARNGAGGARRARRLSPPRARALPW